MWVPNKRYGTKGQEIVMTLTKRLWSETFTKIKYDSRKRLTGTKGQVINTTIRTACLMTCILKTSEERL